MNDVSARLVIKRGPNPELSYTLTPGETSIGRSSTNSIPIADPEVSRRHACIRWGENGYVIEDWGSTNGTFVNGHRVNGTVMLFNEDEIRLGDTIILQFLSQEELFQPLGEHAYVEAVTIVEPMPQVWPIEQEAPADLPPLPADQFILPEQQNERSKFWRWTMGCGCSFLLIIFLCMATVYFLDAYQQGRLLYCGPLRPVFEILMGPFGFAPICS